MIPVENIVPFDKDCTYVVDDDVVIRLSVINNTAVPYITAGERRILIIPPGCEIDDIPKELRTADVILLSQAQQGYDQLRCEDLIISDNSDLSMLSANALKDSYHHVFFTDQGDVRYRLR